MPLDPHSSDARTDSASDVSRRTFVAVSVAAGLAAATASASAGMACRADVTLKTPDGRCDASFFHPASGMHPGVLVWPDAFGLRPAIRTIARRLAGKGYAVLVPNPFYRLGSAAVLEAPRASTSATRRRCRSWGR